MPYIIIVTGKYRPRSSPNPSIVDCRQEINVIITPREILDLQNILTENSVIILILTTVQHYCTFKALLSH